MISTVWLLLYDFFSMKNNFKKVKAKKNFFFVRILNVTDEKSRVRAEARSFGQRNRSEDLDPHQHVTDPEH